MKNLKRALASVLTLIMAITMFAGTVSAEDTVTEDTTTEEEVVDTSYTWTPYKNYSATKKSAVSNTFDETVAKDEAPAVGTTRSQQTVDNGDGTATYTLTTTVVNSVTENADGTTVTVNKTVTTQDTIHVLPYEANPEFDFRIYSSRSNAPGFLECIDFGGNKINNGGTTGGNVSANNILDNEEAAIYPVKPDDDNGRFADVTKHNRGSFYTIHTTDYRQGQYITNAYRDRIMYITRAFNDMWLEFTAPSDGVYTISGYLGVHNITSVSGVTYNFVKIDSLGNRINITEGKEIPLITATAEERALADIKVKLEKGEKLALTTFQANDGAVGKIHLDGYMITKLDYSEAEDKSTVTTNYSYKNYNYEKVYGDNFSLELPKNYEKVWDMNAIRYLANGASTATAALTVDSTTDLSYYNSTTRTLANGSSAWCANTKASYEQYIKYDSVADTLTARVTNRYANSVLYNYGFQFVFTVPEDGNAVLTAPSYIGGGTISIRYGVKKADATTVEYVAPTSSSGEIIMWHTMSTQGNTFNLNNLEVGDQIYLEITSSGTGNGGSRTCYLDSLNIALTTDNSVADVTGDFKADATDAIFMRRHLLRSLTGKVEDLDITGDGLADLRDLVKLKKAIAGV